MIEFDEILYKVIGAVAALFWIIGIALKFTGYLTLGWLVVILWPVGFAVLASLLIGIKHIYDEFS